jgi:hypothetical protein
MNGPFRRGKPISVSGHIENIKFAKYNRTFCYFNLVCEDDDNVVANIPCRITGTEDVLAFYKQGIKSGEFVFLHGNTNLADIGSGRSYWVDVVFVHHVPNDKTIKRRKVDYRVAKNKTWFKLLSNKIRDQIKNIQDHAEVK